MQDLARAAGMSVGNFYRYFPSKAAIVQAMCGYGHGRESSSEFADVQTSDAPPAMPARPDHRTTFGMSR
jgi:AcrR family transcriptional regulator